MYLVHISKVVFVSRSNLLQPRLSPAESRSVVDHSLQRQRELSLVTRHPVTGVQVGVVASMVDNNQDLIILTDVTNMEIIER